MYYLRNLIALSLAAAVVLGCGGGRRCTLDVPGSRGHASGAGRKVGGPFHGREHFGQRELRR